MTTEHAAPAPDPDQRRTLLERDLWRWNWRDGNSVMANRYERAAASFNRLLALIAQDQGIAP